MVVTLSSATVPLPKVRVKTTTAPATLLPKPSVTRATSGRGRSFPMVSTCALPLWMAMALATDALASALNCAAGSPVPTAVAV